MSQEQPLSSNSGRRPIRPVDSVRQLRDHYDWVIIGDEPGALLSACIVGRLGLSVLVLPTGRELKLRTSRSRQVLDLEPNWISGLAHQGSTPGLMRHCLNRLGLSTVDLALAKTDPIDFQVLTPQIRLRLGRTFSDIQDELEKELDQNLARQLQAPVYIETIERAMAGAWSDFPNRFNLNLNTKEKATSPQPFEMKLSTSEKNKNSTQTLATDQLLKKIISEVSNSRELVAWRKHLYEKKIGFLSNGLGGQDFEDFLNVIHWSSQGRDVEWDSFSDSILSFSLIRSASSFQGGRSALKQMLLRVAQKNGAHVPQGRTCKRIFSDRGQLAGVQLSQSGNVIGATGLILGTTLDEASTLLSEENRTASALRSSPPCRGWLFSLSILVPQSSIPPGVSSMMVYGERNSAPLMIEVSSPHEYGAEQTDRRLIFLRSEVPFNPETLKTSYMRLIAARMLNQLDEILPGIVTRALQFYPDHRTADEVQFRECYPFNHLSEIPDSIRILDRHATGSFASGIEGVFLGTRESLPGLGDFAAVVSAIESSAWIAHRNGISSPFL